MRIHAILSVSRSPQIGAWWRDAPENPNRGKEPKSRKPKANADKPATKATKKPAPKSSDAEASGDESDWCGRPVLTAPTC